MFGTGGRAGSLQMSVGDMAPVGGPTHSSRALACGPQSRSDREEVGQAHS